MLPDLQQVIKATTIKENVGANDKIGLATPTNKDSTTPGDSTTGAFGTTGALVGASFGRFGDSSRPELNGE